MMTTGFNHIGEADQVAVDVSVRVDQRVSNAGLCCQVHDLVDALLMKECRHRVAIGDVELVEIEVAALREQGQSVLLELRVVIVVEIVDADDVVASV